MKDGLLLAIDQGTSSTKALLMDASGAIRGRATWWRARPSVRA
jgi:sugar (pentulose or hexulose) kinase